MKGVVLGFGLSVLMVLIVIGAIVAMMWWKQKTASKILTKEEKDNTINSIPVGQEGFENKVYMMNI